MNEPSKEHLRIYREAIWNAMLEKMAAQGAKAIEESEARARLKELTDDELADGIPFNTPEDVADILLGQ